MTKCEIVPFFVIPDLRHSRPRPGIQSFVIPGYDREIQKTVMHPFFNRRLDGPYARHLSSHPRLSGKGRLDLFRESR